MSIRGTRSLRLMPERRATEGLGLAYSARDTFRVLVTQLGH